MSKEKDKKTWWGTAGKSLESAGSKPPVVETDAKATEQEPIVLEEGAVVSKVEQEVQVKEVLVNIIKEEVNKIESKKHDVFEVKARSQAYILSGKTSWVEVAVPEQKGNALVSIHHNMSMKGLMFGATIINIQNNGEVFKVRVLNTDTTPKRIADGEFIANITYL